MMVEKEVGESDTDWVPLDGNLSVIIGFRISGNTVLMYSTVSYKYYIIIIITYCTVMFHFGPS